MSTGNEDFYLRVALSSSEEIEIVAFCPEASSLAVTETHTSRGP